jgi:uncharacterized DUF497 family protein
MDISYDPAKNLELIRRRGISFEEVKAIFLKPHFVDARGGDYPGQSIAIGRHKEKLWTIVFEDIEDDLGSLRWLITFWPSTPQEKRKYHNV